MLVGPAPEEALAESMGECSADMSVRKDRAVGRTVARRASITGASAAGSTKQQAAQKGRAVPLSPRSRPTQRRSGSGASVAVASRAACEDAAEDDSADKSLALAAVAVSEPASIFCAIPAALLLPRRTRLARACASSTEHGPPDTPMRTPSPCSMPHSVESVRLIRDVVISAMAAAQSGSPRMIATALAPCHQHTVQAAQPQRWDEHAIRYENEDQSTSQSIGQSAVGSRARGRTLAAISRPLHVRAAPPLGHTTMPFARCCNFDTRCGRGSPGNQHCRASRLCQSHSASSDRRLATLPHALRSTTICGMCCSRVAALDPS